MPQISSFDIFDTLLTRIVSDPSEIFRICGDRAVQFGWINFSSETFRIVRIEAEWRSRMFYEDGEVRLDEIYREMANTLEIEIETIDKLKNLELEVETEYLIAVPRAYQLIEQARRSHPHILFISDMYLPEVFLEDQLKKAWLLARRRSIICLFTMA